jgi:hypothetical protein
MANIAVRGESRRQRVAVVAVEVEFTGAGRDRDRARQVARVAIVAIGEDREGRVVATPASIAILKRCCVPCTRTSAVPLASIAAAAPGKLRLSVSAILVRQSAAKDCAATVSTIANPTGTCSWVYRIASGCWSWPIGSDAPPAWTGRCLDNPVLSHVSAGASPLFIFPR